jgi:hypothetical protein
MTDIKDLWRNQKTEDTVTLENIHENAARFQRRIGWGNAMEYIMGALVVPVFGWAAWALPGWMTKSGSALCVLGLLFIMWQLHKRGHTHKLPGGAALGLVQFHRGELERRRDLLRSAGQWYILPVVPGMVLILVGRWYQFHVPGRALALDHLVIALGAIIALLIVAVVRLIHVVTAAKLQRKIDELDKL